MDEQILIYAAILVAVIVLTIVGILSRYRKCKSDEVLVVYGKTGDKKSAKLYHGGAAFVWPIIQGYSFLNMKPMQIDCKLTGAISKQMFCLEMAPVSLQSICMGFMFRKEYPWIMGHTKAAPP